MDVAPLLYINRVAERSSLLLPYGLLLSVPAISAISTVPVISMISHVDFLIVLLLLRGPLAMWLKELSSGIGGLNAYIDDWKQISHRLGFLHNNLLNYCEIADPIAEGIDDLDVLDI
jgi:hypothetical protein